jgi:hypothetical protein
VPSVSSLSLSRVTADGQEPGVSWGELAASEHSGIEGRQMAVPGGSAAEVDPSTSADPEATLVAEGAPARGVLHGGRLRVTMTALTPRMLADRPDSPVALDPSPTLVRRTP